MTTVVDPYTFASGGTAFASQINARFAAILAVLNGQVDSSNLASAIQHALFAPGDLKISGAATTSTGWLLCDGAAYSRTGYAALFGAISTNFGAGDGSSTFNVPDLKGRVPVGAGAGSGLTARTLGQKSGEENHLLTAAESGLRDHQHIVRRGTGAPTGAGLYSSTSDQLDFLSETVSGGAQSAVNAHNTMQPFVVVNVFIFTGQ